MNREHPMETSWLRTAHSNEEGQDGDDGAIGGAELKSESKLLQHGLDTTARGAYSYKGLLLSFDRHSKHHETLSLHSMAGLDLEPKLFPGLLGLRKRKTGTPALVSMLGFGVLQIHTCNATVNSHGQKQSRKSAPRASVPQDEVTMLTSDSYGFRVSGFGFRI